VDHGEDLFAHFEHFVGNYWCDLQTGQISRMESHEFSQWLAWYQDIKNRQVGYTRVTEEVYISTVFLAMCSDKFETIIFNGPHNRYQTRYETLKDAIAGHRVAAVLAITALKPHLN